MSRRLCRRCRAPLGIDDEVCQDCGANNPVPLPWYTPILGLVMLALIGLLLIDFSALWAFVEQFGAPKPQQR